MRNYGERAGRMIKRLALAGVSAYLMFSSPALTAEARGAMDYPPDDGTEWGAGGLLYALSCHKPL